MQVTTTRPKISVTADGRAVLEQASWLVPARWGFATTAATADVGKLIVGAADPLWKHSAGVWLFNGALLGLIAVVATAMIAVAIKPLDPRTRSGR